MHLGQPLAVQFIDYIGGVLRGDLGTSLKSGAPVTSEILTRLPATLELTFCATLIAIVFGIPIGVMSATRPNRPFDHVTRVVSLLGVSMPAFLLALILQLVFATYLGLLPVSGRMSPYIAARPVTGFAVLDGILSGDWAATASAIEHLVLPSAVLAAF